MKRIIYMIPLFLLFASCSDFLDYKDKDKVIPSELSQYSELVVGEVIQKRVSTTCYNLLVMSDDYGTYVPSWLGDYTTDERLSYQSWYIWAKESQIAYDGSEMIDPAWGEFYHKILMCNIIERDVNELEDDYDGVKFRLLGEVQALRAMSYWYLVNMYGEPWRSAEQAKTAMGVPINRETSIKDKLYTREPLAKVYELMETDLTNALQNLEKGEQKNTIFRPNKDLVRLFLSRIYLEQKRYDDVITVCNDLLEETEHEIIPYSEMVTYAKPQTPMIHKDSKSLIFSWLKRDTYPGHGSQFGNARYAPSEELVASMASNDVRKKSNVVWDGNIHLLEKYSADFSGCPTMNYRIEEVYFNRAEAYIEKGEWQLGMKDVNKIYAERVEHGALDADNADKAREQLRAEKRRELCFEDMRWFDIRRWGLEVEHKYYNFSMDKTFVTYVLEAESPNYVLPLPLDVQRRNFQIEQPERIEVKKK